MNKRPILINLVLILCLLPLLSCAREVDVICVNDLHGNVMPYGKNLGMAKLTAVIKTAVKRNPDTVVVFGGDNYAGSTLTDFFHAEPVNDLIHKLHIAASAVGNHEFDHGINRISAYSKAGHFPFVAANIFQQKTNRLVEWAKPYVMIKKGGIKIAFIGLATQETPATTFPGCTNGLIFKNPAKCAQHWIDYLKSGKDPAGKPDVIIALTHIPSSQNFASGKIINSKELFDLCKHTKGLDAVLSAHSHQIVHGFVNHIPVVQGYCYGRALAYLKIIINHRGKIKIIPQVDLAYKRKKYIAPDKNMQMVLQHYIKLLPAKYRQVLAISTGDFHHNVGNLKSHPLDVWFCSLLQKDFHTQICMINGGFVRGDLPRGPVTRLSLNRVVYFPNKIVTLRLSGKDIYNLLNRAIPHGIQISGLKIYYNPQAKKNRIKKILYHRKPIRRDQYYSIVINDFMLNGGDDEKFAHAVDVVRTNKLVTDEIALLVHQQKIIHPRSINNLIII